MDDPKETNDRDKGRHRERERHRDSDLVIQWLNSVSTPLTKFNCMAIWFNGKVQEEVCAVYQNKLFGFFIS